MKNSRMNARGFVEYDKSRVRPGPEFKCFECGGWFKRLLYWSSKQFNSEQKYDIMFLCSAKCALEKYERNR